MRDVSRSSIKARYACIHHVYIYVSRRSLLVACSPLGCCGGGCYGNRARCYVCVAVSILVISGRRCSSQRLSVCVLVGCERSTMSICPSPITIHCAYITICRTVHKLHYCARFMHEISGFFSNCRAVHHVNGTDRTYVYRFPFVRCSHIRHPELRPYDLDLPI